jgi:hypothetical protein
MTFKFTSKSKAQAEKFQQYIKADRNLDSTVSEKDGKFVVEYNVPDLALAAKKKKAKKAKSNDKQDKMGDEKKGMPEEKCMSKAAGVEIEVEVCPDCEDEEEGMCEEDVMDMLSEFARYFYNEMQYQLNWVWAEIDWIENAFYKHVSQGHLPPINGAEKMQKALDTLGLGGDYQVQKPVVYASTKRGVELELDLTAKK